MKFTEDVIKSCRMCAVFLDEPACSVFNLALDEIERLQARVAELEVEGKQVCESTIFEQDYQTWNGDWESAYRCRTGCGVQQKISSDTCHDCGKRIKYVESVSSVEVE